MKFLKYTLMVLLALSLFSCGSSSGGDDDDETAPSISISSPSSSTVVAAGNDLSVQFTASDNVSLDSYVLTVDYSSSASSSSVTSISTKNVEKFSFTSVTGKDADGNNLPSITGTTTTVGFDMAIDYTAEPGMYKMTVTVTDSSNNDKTEDVTFEIE